MDLATISQENDELANPFTMTSNSLRVCSHHLNYLPSIAVLLQLREEIFQESTLMCKDHEVGKLLQSRIELANSVVKAADGLHVKSQMLGIKSTTLDEHNYWQAHVNCTASGEDREIVNAFYKSSLRDLEVGSTTCDCQD